MPLIKSIYFFEHIKEYPKIFVYGIHQTPIGNLVSLQNKEGMLFHIFFNVDEFIAFNTLHQETDFNEMNTSSPHYQKIDTELSAYFAGKLIQFTIPLMLKGTDFQLDVWQGLCEIPYGKTISYLDLANKINRPKAIRAVGSANGANPIPIIIPCHRVIAHNGGLGGYAGGLPVKSALLAIEEKSSY